MATVEGACTPRLTDFMRKFAQGGAGLIGMSPAYVREDNQCFGPGMAGEGIHCVVEKERQGGRSG
ncbi:MAG: hypothetical protein JXL84_21280 [Deltaproteobacteria bacterium]|nr:hypothetical protein [Deltaproteobacteria bacterium]